MLTNNNLVNIFKGGSSNCLLIKVEHTEKYFYYTVNVCSLGENWKIQMKKRKKNI